jgi:hypothetical protein
VVTKRSVFWDIPCSSGISVGFQLTAGYYIPEERPLHDVPNLFSSQNASSVIKKDEVLWTCSKHETVEKIVKMLSGKPEAK